METTNHESTTETQSRKGGVMGSTSGALRWTSLENNPELETKIKTQLERIGEVLSNNRERHLCDTAVLIDFISKGLKKISEEAFELHRQQKSGWYCP